MLFNSNFLKLYEELNKLNENAEPFIKDVNSPEELLDWMEENITYELANDEYGAEDDPPTKTAEEVLATGTGHCAEQSYLEKKVLDELGYETQLIFVKENNSKDDYGADGSAHVFLTYQDDDEKYFWFEHSMEHAKGIHKFNSFGELLQDVAAKWWRYDENSDILEVRFLDKPITGVNNWELAQACHEYPVDEVLDISNNVLEKDAPEEGLTEELTQIEYRPLSDIELFKKYAAEILGGYGEMSDSDIKEYIKEIYINGELKGYIGFSKYTDGYGSNALGIGNFMIIERGQGYGTKVIQDVISKYKNEYDLIYCFVEANNTSAISLYKKLGKVYDEDPSDSYYVTFYDNGRYKLDN